MLEDEHSYEWLKTNNLKLIFSSLFIFSNLYSYIHIYIHICLYVTKE